MSPGRLRPTQTRADSPGPGTAPAQRRAELAAQQLEADVRRPADAEAYRQRAIAEAARDQAKFAADADAYRTGTLAAAEAQAAKVQADAAAYAERATAEADANRSRAGSLADGNEELIAAHRIVESLPELVSAAAPGLAASNLTVLNGTDGLGQIMTGLVGQGLTVLDALRRSTAAVPPASLSHDGHDGSAAESSPALS